MAAKLASKQGTKISHIVLTTKNLPPEMWERLSHIASSSSHCEIIQCAPTSAYPGDELRSALKQNLYDSKGDDVVATVWLDDDDILSSRYIKYLEEYASSVMVDQAISFTNGFAGVAQSGNGIARLGLCYQQKVTCGLAYLVHADTIKNDKAKPATIYDLGPHPDIDQMMPVIADGREPLWIRTFHPYMDSVGRGGKNINWLIKTPYVSEKNSIDFSFFLKESRFLERYHSAATMPIRR